MSRVADCMSALKAQNKKALIPYITAGDPDADTTLAVLHELVKSGADMLELGVPFSDPMADGPAIQLACERALEAGMSLRGALKIVEQFRQTDTKTPIVLMGYLNPIEAMGYSEFAKQAAAVGVDAVLMVDLTAEEAPSIAPQIKAAGLDCVFLIAPTTPVERVATIAEYGSGYLYYVSLKGVTGSGQLDVNAVSERTQAIRQVTDLPLAVGFGINNGESAQAIASVSDAVIVGSALVKLIEQGGSQAEILQRIAGLNSELRAGVDAASA